MSDSSKKILIVEDEPALAKAVIDTLRTDGYAVDHATNGEIALEHLKKVQYDCLIVDLIMPVMSGQSLLKKLEKDSSYQGKIIVLSALEGNTDVADALASGAVQFLKKSNISLKEVSDIVKQITS